MPASIGKWLAMGGIVVLVLSMAPLGACIDPHDSWWGTRWKWMPCALRQEHAATPATVNPPDNHIEGSSSERYSWVVDAM